MQTIVRCQLTLNILLTLLTVTQIPAPLHAPKLQYTHVRQNYRKVTLNKYWYRFRLGFGGVQFFHYHDTVDDM